jgi:hypothetical protein
MIGEPAPEMVAAKPDFKALELRKETRVSPLWEMRLARYVR